MNIEYMTVPLTIKSAGSGRFEGYGSTFGNVDLGGDVVMPGAFKDSLAEYREKDEWPQMFWMHHPEWVPGIWTDMAEDKVGLKVAGESIPTAIGKDVEVMIERKAVRRMSIGFSLDSRSDYEFKDGVRLLHRINLWEVSPVSLAMNPQAKISAVKALLHKRGMCLTDFKRELEHWLRDRGLSKSQSRSIAGRALAPDDFPDFSPGAMPELGDSGDEPGVMPAVSRCDADDKATKNATPNAIPEDEREAIHQLAKALDGLGDTLITGSFQRHLSKFNF